MLASEKRKESWNVLVRAHSLSQKSSVCIISCCPNVSSSQEEQLLHLRELMCLYSLCPACFWGALSPDVQILVFERPYRNEHIWTPAWCWWHSLHLHKIIHGHKDQNKQSLIITAMQEHEVETQQMVRDMSFQTHEEISHKASAMCLCYVSLQILMLFGITFYILGINWNAYTVCDVHSFYKLFHCTFLLQYFCIFVTFLHI